MKIEIPKVNGSRGAPMGRQSDIYTKPVRLYLQKMDMVDGGYDRGGAYWGMAFDGNEMYVAADSQQYVMVFVRAKSRADAKADVKEYVPKAMFYK